MKKAPAHVLGGRIKQIAPGESVLQPLPHKDFRFANPFILLHHAGPDTIAPGSAHRIHPHPHRGFAPVTFMLQGEGYHKDNAGHDETIHAGDVQWMFAGKGILHSEGPAQQLLENGGTMEFVQLWINVPASHKWDEPFYQTASHSQLPVVLQQPGVDLRLACGEYGGSNGPLKSFTPIVTIIGKIAKEKQVIFTATPGYWTLLYLISGSASINGQPVSGRHLVVFEKQHDEVEVTALEDAQLLFLSAEPIEEPVAAKDNFVMNTPEETEQAMTDYKNGLFGELSY